MGGRWLKEVNIYLASGIPSMQKKTGYVAYCLEYYPQGRAYPEVLTDVEEVEEMTGRCSEIVVLQKALKRLNEKCILSIYTESSYLYMGIGERRFVDKWAENDWKDVKMLPVKNETEWRAISEVLNGNTYEVFLNQPNKYIKMLHNGLKIEGDLNVKRNYVKNQAFPVGNKGEAAKAPSNG